MDKQIKDYIAVQRPHVEDLMGKVQERIKKGWQPWGSLQVVNDITGNLCFVQALVLYERMAKRKGQKMETRKEILNKVLFQVTNVREGAVQVTVAKAGVAVGMVLPHSESNWRKGWDDACNCIQAILKSEIQEIEEKEKKEELMDEKKKPRPTIVCLCGSTRFSDAFQRVNWEETLKGKIVLSIGCNLKSDDALGLPEDTKIKLDELHMRKIDLADEILVLNVNGYIGQSTSNEIAYAAKLKKKIRYLESPCVPTSAHAAGMRLEPEEGSGHD